MSVLIGETAPDFQAETTKGPISFHDWIGDSWAFFFSHPADFTPVCTTEMGRTAQLADRFAALDTKPIGLSTDTVEEHLKWIGDINDTQSTNVGFPIIADPDLRVAKLYGMIHQAESETAAVRTVFIIDPKKKVRLTMTYPMSVGRNFDEILRAITALQTSDGKRLSMPADWQPGKDAIIPPSISNADAKSLYPQGWNELRPYLRLTKTQ